MPGACGHAHAFGRSLIREPDAGNPHVRFDEREVETEQGALLGHRQPKGPATRKAHLPHRATSRLYGVFFEECAGIDTAVRGSGKG